VGFIIAGFLKALGESLGKAVGDSAVTVATRKAIETGRPSVRPCVGDPLPRDTAV
jgi:hypothetical protein